MEFKELKELALHSAKRTAPTNYSVNNVDAALRDGMAAIAGSINEFMRNRFDIYQIIIETADEIVPTRIKDSLSMFAEIREVGQGEKIMFKTPLLGKNRAKKFLTQVGLSGIYETFRLDRSTFSLETKAVGGGASIDFERFLDGADNMQDLMDIIVEGQLDATFVQVQKALIAAKDAAGRPEANLVIENNFDGEKMFKLVSTVKNYGSAVIFATPEFIGAMGPDAIVPAISGAQGIYSPDDIQAIHDTGYIKIFRGTPVVELQQSYIDENNDKTWLNPQFAFVLPAGKEKVVKIGLEGGTQIWDLKNPDQSMEIYTYRKLGVAILTHYNWGIYQNTGITDTSENPYGF